ncbi:MAG: phage protein Gp36 family protein [Rikenellaceae bacterium]
MFLTENDYVVTSTDALNILQQSTVERREIAEKMACEEIAGYLRSRYDTEQVFAAEDEDRNTLIVMYACDITLYHLVSWLPNKMGREIRKERYEQAIKWLGLVQDGTISPDLPTYTGENGEEDINNPVAWGSGKKQKYDW